MQGTMCWLPLPRSLSRVWDCHFFLLQPCPDFHRHWCQWAVALRIVQHRYFLQQNRWLPIRWVPKWAMSLVLQCFQIGGSVPSHPQQLNPYRHHHPSRQWPEMCFRYCWCWSQWHSKFSIRIERIHLCQRSQTMQWRLVYLKLLHNVLYSPQRDPSLHLRPDPPIVESHRVLRRSCHLEWSNHREVTKWVILGFLRSSIVERIDRRQFRSQCWERK